MPLKTNVHVYRYACIDAQYIYAIATLGVRGIPALSRHWPRDMFALSEAWYVRLRLFGLGLRVRGFRFGVSKLGCSSGSRPCDTHYASGYKEPL